ncbi:choice-of-anchor L domain-containing protein, partial [Flavobacterium rivuli]
MKKHLLFLVLLFTIKGFSQNTIVVAPAPAPTTGTVLNQWVSDNLISSSCLAQTSNMTKSTGLSYGYESIGSFTNANPNFAFSRGVLLSTGRAINAAGPNTTVSSDENIAWTGDADLEAALAAGGVTMTSMNATYLEFDFVAATSTLSIDYIFASEEYGQFQCNSKDGFAILLKTGNGAYRNLALVPSTSNAVSVATIRNNAYVNSAPAGCTSQNEAYFGSFNGGTQDPANPSATNYEGQTVVMNASAVLVPGTTYHIKIVIADDGNGNPNNLNGNDGKYDSAVFFPKDGFNLGQNILEGGLTLEGGNALCQGETYRLNSNLDANDYILSWTKDGANFAGDVSSIDITQPGRYQLRIETAAGCVDTQEEVVEFAPALVPGTPNNLYACTNSSNSYVYDLSQNTPVIKLGLNPATTVTYHATQEDADLNRAALPLSYTSTGGVTIYARVKSHNSSCYTVVSFTLLALPAATATRPATLSACESTANTGSASFNLTQLRPAILGSQNANDFTVSFFTSQDNANTNTAPITGAGTYPSASATLYARVQSVLNPGCFATTPFTVAVVPLPPIGPVPGNQTVCTNYTLPALTNGGAYYSQPGGLSPLPANYVVTSTQTIYVYAASNTTLSCPNEASFVVTVNAPGTVPQNVNTCVSYILPVLPAGQQYRTAANGGGRQLQAGDVLTESQTVYFYMPAAAACTANTSFTITITTANIPAAAVNGVVNVCSPYELPELQGGARYFPRAGSAGGEIPPHTIISSNQTIYIYNRNLNAECIVENNFNIVITNTTLDPVAPVNSCGPYTLPSLNVGSYYSASGGNASNLIPAGTVINTTQTIFVHASVPNNPACTNEASFLVSINPIPTVPAIDDVISCLRYQLPDLGGGITYFTNPDATGTEYQPNSFVTVSDIYYATTPANAQGCRGVRPFKVQIIEATLDAGPDQYACDSYGLPELPVGEYFTEINGGGRRLPAGTQITQSRTIYVYATNEICTAQDNFVVTIQPIPVLPDMSNVTVCTSYTLPAPPAGSHYYSATGGQAATILPDNYTVTSTQDIYLFASIPGTDPIPTCVNEVAFSVTIITGSVAPADVPPTCAAYVLPALPIGEYRTARNGGGTILPVGTRITATQQIYVFVPVTTGTNCTADANFNVNIIQVVRVNNQPNVLGRCQSYTLPALPAGNFYYLLPGGPNATGQTPVSAGYVVTESRFIYVHNNNVDCPIERSFRVQIIPLTIDPVQDRVVCENEGYVLPQLEVGTYYTATGGPAGNGTLIPVGTVLNTPQTVYVYAEASGSNPLCTDETSFEVRVTPSPAIISPEPVDADGVAQGFSCGNYTLPALTGPGAYFTERGGQGQQLIAGAIIDSSQLIYIYAEGGGTLNCSSELDFNITVNPQAPDAVTICDVYVLPELLPGQFYYDGPGGNTGSANVIPAGTEIRTTQDIYYFIQNAAACTVNSFFTVTINNTPILAPVSPISVCDEYYLPALTVGNYYNGSNATGGLIDITVPITAPAGTTSFYTKTVYVYAETNTFPNCSVEAAFEVIITPRPMIDSRSNVDQCDEFVLGNLTTGEYRTASFADGGGTVIPAGTPIRSSQRIYIFGASPNPVDRPECYSENSFQVNIYAANADTILTPGQTGITACDSFTLPVNGISGNPIDLDGDDFTQHYYLTNPVVTGDTSNPLPVGYTFDIANEAPTVNAINTTVYIYQQLKGRYQCESVVEVPIAVYRTPQVPDVANESVCFSYTVPSLPALVNASDAGVTSAYYTQPGGPSGTGTVIRVGTEFTATGNTTRTETLWLYASTGNNQCFTEDSYTVTINSIEVPEPADVLACESYTLPALTIGNYFTAPNGGGTPLFAGDAITTVGINTIYIYGVTATTPACTDESSYEVEVIARPRGIVPQALHACAIDDANNQGIFDLTPALTEALDNQADVAASIYETMEDAQFDHDAITSLTAYRSVRAATQTLYIRLYSTRGVECYSIVEVRLIVDPRPVAIVPTAPYSICDNGVSDTDGIGVFDLTTYESQVLGTLNPAQFDVAYYRDAAATDEIANPGTFESTGQIVYIKVFNIITGCDDIVELELIVNPMPAVVTPTPYMLCDDTTVGTTPDEREVFDLTTKIAEITNGVNGLVVTFHTSFQDADTDNNAISDADSRAYTNLTTVQTLFVRVEDGTSGCYRIVLMDLRVEPLPTLLMPTADDRTICDSDGNGYGEINLEDLIEDMIDNGGANIVVRFYMTQIGAENNNPNSVITNLAEFVNQNPGMGQTVYVRAENTITGCLSQVYPLDLIFNAAPTLPAIALAPLRECDDELDQDDQDGIAEFDLTFHEAAIRALNPANPVLTITYHATEAEAEEGTPIIISPTTYQGTNEQVIWVRIENPVTECYTVTSFELLIDTPVDVAQPTALVKCDYEQLTATPPNASNNQSYVFDLTEKDEEILGATGQGQDNIVQYYETLTDITNNNPIPDFTAYTNTSNPQTLQVVVTTINGCKSYTTLTIKVIPLPTPNPTPDPLEECDDVSGDGIAEFNLTEANANILQHSTLTTLKYYVLESDALAGTNPILDFTSHFSTSTTIYVRAELAGSEPGDPVCAVVVPLELIVNPLPATSIAPYGICQTNFTGFAQFDLGNYRSTILPAGAVLTDYTVRFYAIDPRVTPPGSANGNPSLPFLYTNTVYRTQTIWVYAQNLDTECDVVLPLVLSVEPQTIANPVDDTVIRECDYDGVNDGITTVDLTEADAVIIGTQVPIDNTYTYVVTYYLTEADARAGQNAITNPSAYPTATTVLWAAIRSTLPYGCPAYTAVPVTIDLLPAPVISSDNDSHTSCVDFETNTVLRYVVLHSNVAPANNTFQWFKDGVAIAGATSADYSAFESGIYTVVVTGGAPNFCVSDAIPGWDVTMSGPASLIGDGYVVSNAFSDSQTITVLVEGYGDYQYSMYVDGPWQNSNVF